MSLDKLAQEPCFSVTMRGAAVEATGPSRFFRGHTIAAAADRPDGIFAEWSWDGQRLDVRNDRYGAAPLFYAWDGTRLLLSPSIIKLVEAGAATDLDEPALALFLRLGFFVGDDTPFRAIRAVPPAATMTWREGRLSISGGYRMVPAQRIGRVAAMDGFVDLFRDAIGRRPPVQDDLVVPLSGGRDSRHILLELCERGWRPRTAMTIPRYPPRSREDERLAPIVAGELGVPHTLLRQTEEGFASEFRKNWETHLCADEHAWYVAMVDQLDGRTGTVYDGLGGALSVPNRFLSREALDLFAAGKYRALAERMLRSFARSTEPFLERVLSRRWASVLTFDCAVTRLAEELQRHQDAADPIKSFNFWNRIRRELALTPYGLMRHVPTVYSPYLDYELFDFLSSLNPEVMSPTLSASDKSFHTDAILRGYPRFSHIPFERKDAPRRDPREHEGQLFADTARHLITHWSPGPALLNRAYVWPRMQWGLVNRRYREAAGWLPGMALYLFQLDALARGCHAAVDAA